VPNEWRQYPLRMPVALYDWLVARAKAEDRSLNNLIVRLLTRVRNDELGETGQADPPEADR
jgi:hypothetical protein